MVGMFSNYEKEAQRLKEVLGIKTGSVVAEIGAGAGEMALEIAEIVGPPGFVYITDLDRKMIKQMISLFAEADMHNVEVLQGSQSNTNLPSNSCDAIIMRAAYHHLTSPDEFTASLYETIRPNGRVAIIDFDPGFWSRPWRPTGVPANRGGHGMPKKILVEEMNEAGFDQNDVFDPWFGRFYCYVFRKPLFLSKNGRKVRA